MLKTDLEALNDSVSALHTDKVAVAFSGGGDSTALLHALRNHPKASHAFIIDHNLRAESEEETARSAAYARQLGYIVETQRWDNNNPSTAIQVKARQYRYAAMGEMCRANGITHLLTAHTEDDQAETLLMRQNRKTGWRGLAGMRASAYGPLWPALAEVTLMRPLLGQSREALREYNNRFNLPFIDDPSNENEDFTRVRARRSLTANPTLKSELLESQKSHLERLMDERAHFNMWFSDHACLNEQGYFELTQIPPSELFLHCLRIAGGTGGPVDSARREALLSQMEQSAFKAATLAGAWIVQSSQGFVITRDKVAVTGRKNAHSVPLASTLLIRGVPHLWDGRFLIDANVEGIRVEPAYGQLQDLREASETQHIFTCPEAVRPVLPVFKKEGQYLGVGAGTFDGVSAVSLASKRLKHLWTDK